MIEANSENANITKPSLSSMKYHSDRKMTIPLVCSKIQKTATNSSTGPRKYSSNHRLLFLSSLIWLQVMEWSNRMKRLFQIPHLNNFLLSLIKLTFFFALVWFGAIYPKFDRGYESILTWSCRLGGFLLVFRELHVLREEKYWDIWKYCNCSVLTRKKNPSSFITSHDGHLLNWETLL